MLQVTSSNRPSCEQLLSSESLLKRIELQKSEKLISNQPATLLKTIKLPRNMNEINKALPKKLKKKPVYLNIKI